MDTRLGPMPDLFNRVLFQVMGHKVNQCEVPVLGSHIAVHLLQKVGDFLASMSAGVVPANREFGMGIANKLHPIHHAPTLIFR